MSQRAVTSDALSLSARKIFVAVNKMIKERNLDSLDMNLKEQLSKKLKR